MLKYIPGFRSKNKVKMIIASLYYAMSIFVSIEEVGVAGLSIYIGIPLAILSLSSYIKGSKTDKIYRSLSYVGAALITAGGVFTASQSGIKSNSQIIAQSVSSSDKITNSENVNLIFSMLSQSQETKAISVLKECGIEKIKKVTHDDMLDGDGLKGYRLSTEYDKISDVIAYFDNEKIRQVRFLGEYLYKNQEVVQKVEAIVNRPKLEVLEYNGMQDGYSRYIVGKIKNNSKKIYSYVQVSINLYYKGNLVGSTMDNINNLEPGTTWEFKAIIFEKEVDEFKIMDVNGF